MSHNDEDTRSTMVVIMSMMMLMMMIMMMMMMMMMIMIYIIKTSNARSLFMNMCVESGGLRLSDLVI